MFVTARMLAPDEARALAASQGSERLVSVSAGSTADRLESQAQTARNMEREFNSAAAKLGVAAAGMGSIPHVIARGVAGALGMGAATAALAGNEAGKKAEALEKKAAAAREAERAAKAAKEKAEREKAAADKAAADKAAADKAAATKAAADAAAAAAAAAAASAKRKNERDLSDHFRPERGNTYGGRASAIDRDRTDRISRTC